MKFHQEPHHEAGADHEEAPGHEAVGPPQRRGRHGGIRRAPLFLGERFVPLGHEPPTETVGRRHPAGGAGVEFAPFRRHPGSFERHARGLRPAFHPREPGQFQSIVRKLICDRCQVVAEILPRHGDRLLGRLARRLVERHGGHPRGEHLSPASLHVRRPGLRRGGQVAVVEAAERARPSAHLGKQGAVLLRQRPDRGSPESRARPVGVPQVRGAFEEKVQTDDDPQENQAECGDQRKSHGTASGKP